MREASELVRVPRRSWSH